MYDIRSSSSEPVFDSLGSPGKNTDVTWQVLWTDRGENKGEAIASASSDGGFLFLVLFIPRSCFSLDCKQRI